MSLSYRTPGETFCNFLSQKHTEGISIHNIDRFGSREARLAPFFSFSLSEKKKKIINDWGIYLSPFSWESHSHPACKTIENEILFNSIYNFVHSNPSSDFAFLSLRDRKFQVFRDLLPKPKKKNFQVVDDPVMEHLSNFNRTISVKDKIRYGVDKAISNKDCFKEIPTSFKGKHFIIHDEIHYWNPSQLHNFIEEFEPETILGTLIHPTEVEYGYSKSMLPEIYEFELIGDSLFFFPDGNKSEGYEQPRTAGWLLHCNKFLVNDLVYSVSIVRSLGPFHLVALVKGNAATESHRFFNDFSCIDFNSRMLLRGPDFSKTRLKGNTFRKIVRYVLSLKKPDKESVMAKLRMMDDESTDLDESLLCAKITSSLLKDKVLENFDRDLIDWLLGGLRDFFGDRLLQIFSSQYFRQKSNLELLMNFKELEVRLKTRSMDRLYSHQSLISEVFSRFLEQKDAFDEVSKHLQIYAKGNLTKNFPNRGIILNGMCSSQYSGNLINIEGDDGNQKILQMSMVHGKFCLETFVDNAYLNDLSEEMQISLTRSSFLNDKKRFNDACEQSKLRKGSFLSDNYYAFCVRDVDSPYYKSGYRLVFINIKWVNKFGENANFWVAVQLTFCLYPMHFPISNGDDTASLISKKEILTGADQVAWLYELASSNSFDDLVTARPSDKREEIPESQILSYDCVGSLIDISGLKNSCCFIALQNAMSITLEEFLSLLDDNLIRILLKDEGMLIDEFIDALTFLKINGLVHDGSGNLISRKLNNSGSNWHVFESRESHMTYQAVFDSEEQALSTYGLLEGSLGMCQFLLTGGEKDRVDKLIKCFKEGHTGVLVKEKLLEIRNRERENKAIYMWGNLPYGRKLMGLISCVSSKNRFFINLGAAGSGKSRKLIHAITEGELRQKKVLLISPRKELLKTFKESLNGMNHVVCLTFESALCYGNLFLFDVFVIDEIGLYPNGYLDLFVLTSTLNTDLAKKKKELTEENFVGGKVFYILGDPFQCSYHGERDSIRLSSVNEIDHCISGCIGNPRYKNYSFRNASNFQFNLGHENLGEASESITKHKVFINCNIAMAALKDFQVLVASQEEQLKFKQFGAMTFGSSQGLSFDNVLICLSPCTLASSNEAIYVAFSRARNNVAFFLNGYVSLDDFLERARGSCLQALLTVNHFDFISVGIQFLKRRTGKDLLIEKRKGINQEEIESKLEGDSYLKAIIPLLEPINIHVEPCYDEEVDPANPKVHIPIWEKNNYCAEVVSRMKNRELREFREGNTMSEQFPDFFKKGEPQGLLPNPCRFQGIYPKHSNSDPLTFFAAVKKRLKFSCPAKEREKFESVLHIGQEMFEVFLKFIPIRNDLNQMMFEKSIDEYVQKKVSKSKGTISVHSSRSEPDWGKHEIFLFIKTQLCTKYERRFSDAKAGQTLACFSHRLLNRFAAPCRYLEKKIQEVIPDRFYIHQKKDFNVLNKWVIGADFSNVCTESDYEAFDSSQDALILAMEYHFLKHIQWDDDLINDYLDMKFHLGCRLGNLAVMRFTGEFGTFILNTVCNMAFTFMTYEINSNVHIAFAGDDMCANQVLVPYGENGPYSHILKRLTLKAKVDYTKNPTFCGWRLTKSGLYKRPELLVERLLIAEEKGCLKETLDGYLLEFSYAYKLGEWLFDSFSEKEFEAHYICTRFFVKNKKKISKSLQPFVEKISGERIGCLSSRSMSSLRNTTLDKKLLIVSTPMQSTVIQDFQKGSSLMLCKEMNVLSLYNHMEWIALLQGYHLFIKTPSKKKGERESTNGSILVPYQYLCINLDTMTQKKQKAPSSLLMAEKKVAGVLSKLMTLIYQKNPHTSSLHQMPISLWMMKCYFVLAKFMLNLMVISMKKGPNLLQLNLVLFSVSQMPLIVFIKWVMLITVNLEAIIRPFLTQLVGMCQGSMMLILWLTKQLLKVVSIFLNHQNHQQPLKERKGSMVAKGEDHQNFLNTRLSLQLKNQDHWVEVTRLGRNWRSSMNLDHLTIFWGIHLEGRLEFCQTEGNMSLNRSLAKPIRDWVLLKSAPGKPKTPPNVNLLRIRRRMMLRHHYVITLHSSFPKLGQDPTKWNADQNNQYKKIVDDWAAYIFGNLAIYGFSESTVYPPLDVEYEVEYDDPPTKVKLSCRLNDVKHMFKYYCDQSGEDYLASLTWRQIGECFAEDVRTYLRDMEPEARTWLVRNNPLVAGNAPWVATDITSGLWKALSPEEKKTITKTNNHLLKTMNARSQMREGDISTLES